VAYYYAWSNRTGPQKVAAMAQARVFFPEGPELLYELGRDDRMSKLIPSLLASGSSWHTQDDEDLNALGYALSNENIEAARRLVKLGARFDDPVGPENMPVAFIPFMMGSVEGVRFEIESGVDLNKVSFRGVTLAQFATRVSKPEITELIKKRKAHGQSET